MGRMVTHALGVEGKVYGTVFVTCDEDEHHPERLVEDSEIEWHTDKIEWVVVDGDITEAWDEDEEEEERRE
jgi:hypothetical protein